MSGDAFDYDLLVIGSGPAGQRAAIQGAKLNKKVAIVERRTVLGGCSVNLGTIPSKTLREAALELCGYRSREFYGASYTVKQHITMQDLLFRTDRVIQHEIDVTRHQLMRNNVELIAATACFVGPDALRLDYVDAATSRTVKAKKIVIAAGAETTRAPNIPFDGERIFTSDDVLQLDRLPRTLAVVGAGVIGCEYASIFAALGVRVTLIDKRDRLVAVRRPRNRRRVLPSPAGKPGHLAAQRERRQVGNHRGRARPTRQAAPRQRQDDHRREGALLGRPDRRHQQTQPRGSWPDARQPRSAGRRRPLSNPGPRHLRGRRHDRVPGARLDLDGARPAGGVPRLRGQGAERPRAFPVRDLRGSRNLDGRQERGGAERSLHSRTKSARPATRKSPAARSSATSPGF